VTSDPSELVSDFGENIFVHSPGFGVKNSIHQLSSSMLQVPTSYSPKLTSFDIQHSQRSVISAAKTFFMVMNFIFISASISFWPLFG
jgi:hypothetical protein